MSVSDVLVGVDKNTGLKARVQLQNNLCQMDGVVMVKFQQIKPHCQGLLIRYDPMKIRTDCILRTLNDFDDQVEWNSCYPGEHCKTCELHLV